MTDTDLEVGIHAHKIRPPCLLETPQHRTRQALLARRRPHDHPNIMPLRSQLFDLLHRPVPRVIVHEHDLHSGLVGDGGEDAGDQRTEVVLFVVAGDDDGGVDSGGGGGVVWVISSMLGVGESGLGRVVGGCGPAAAEEEPEQAEHGDADEEWAAERAAGGAHGHQASSAAETVKRWKRVGLRPQTIAVCSNVDVFGDDSEAEEVWGKLKVKEYLEL
jgi:hypothetical protein